MTLQTQVQSIFDFAVVVCHSIPALKLQMKLLDEGKITKLPDPDYFEANNPTTKLREQADGYKDKLATYLFLSSFAFFENYLGSALKEVLALSVSIPEKETLKSSLTNNTNTKPKKILRSTYDARHMQRYEKYSRELDAENYIHPNDLVSIIAVESLIKTIVDLKANQIPDFLINTIKMDISDSDKKSFGTYRQLRNDIAHGDNPTVTMRKVKEANKFLRKFATQIDEFLIEHYVKIKNYIT
ncbi:hypothetical protein SAMN05216327_12045 [Dyadobacter sp. SG02]|uniref:HEPN domain-containing protein n=1 Tax=Dyadobacter sp. SG02 TaxID=1855291 RepID=UPI0008BC6EB1|nr:HEPN domain-containing protein [Dyadobacter sp. SG02]SEJ79312.1 hypothetical protein SAMN05216327_12045 [Dyadobacter sp. SG02]